MHPLDENTHSGQLKPRQFTIAEKIVDHLMALLSVASNPKVQIQENPLDMYKEALEVSRKNSSEALAFLKAELGL